jgi:hypothetical protein
MRPSSARFSASRRGSGAIDTAAVYAAIGSTAAVCILLCVFLVSLQVRRPQPQPQESKYDPLISRFKAQEVLLWKQKRRVVRECGVECA